MSLKMYTFIQSFCTLQNSDVNVMKKILPNYLHSDESILHKTIEVSTCIILILVVRSTANGK